MSNGRETHGWTAVALSLILSVSWAAEVRSGEGAEPPPIPRTKPLTYYTSLVDTRLPAFDSSMLTVANGPNWMAGKTIHQVAVAVQDSDPGTIIGSGPILMGYDPPDGPRFIKIDFDEGYIRYSNRNRSFHAGSPCVAVSSTEAEGSFVSTAGTLGLPTTEWSTRTVNTVMERSVDGEGQDPPTEVTCEIEQMVIMNRKASNGYPIFECEARESISNIHERARLLIDWPQFLMQTGLIMRTRADVVSDMGRQIWEAESNTSGLGAEVDLEVALGYVRTSEGFVPVARAAFADIYSRFAGEILYVQLAYNPSSGVGSPEALAEVQFRVRVDAAGGNTLVEFYLPRSETVRLTIADVSGREVRVLAEAPFSTGWHQLEWNQIDSAGRRVAAGVYFAKLRAGREAPTRKILVVR